MSEGADSQDVSGKLDLIIRLLALNLSDGKRQADQIVLLNRAGFTPRQIAELLGTSANTVSVELSRLRRQGVLETPARGRKARG
jgi:DNA-directed RNA polymerase specialized sigma24 family protein